MCEIAVQLTENTFFRPIQRTQSASFTELMKGLNIDEWSERDLTDPEMGGGSVEAESRQ